MMRFNLANGVIVPDDYVYWALIGRRKSFGVAVAAPLNFSAGEMRSLVAHAVCDFPPGLQALIAGAPASAISAVTVRHTRQGARAGSTPVTVLGDAIHTMSPAAGLGANTALRDAATLAAHLQAAEGNLKEKINRYEQEMLQYSAEAIAASKKGSQLLYNAEG
jgi:2-polyprenyl-6-methoxyphenol hydroxylase-like FAD-dependent oxidoreductase